jgi:hypothetical protein
MMKPTSKRRRLRAALLRRAQAAIGANATALDYVEQYVANRGRFSDLAASLRLEMGEPLSRGFLSFIANRLASDARRRIAAARQEAHGGLQLDALRLVRVADDHTISTRLPLPPRPAGTWRA